MTVTDDEYFSSVLFCLLKKNKSMALVHTGIANCFSVLKANPVKSSLQLSYDTAG